MDMSLHVRLNLITYLFTWHIEYTCFSTSQKVFVIGHYVFASVLEFMLNHSYILTFVLLFAETHSVTQL